jgi:regulator of PEP synthase PpsR (kinase-PPPase family)
MRKDSLSPKKSSKIPKYQLSISQNFIINLISDGTGKTATNIIQAVLTQFSDIQATLKCHKNIQSLEMLENIYLQASIHKEIICYTLVEPKLKEYAEKLGVKFKVRNVDLLTPILIQFTNFFESVPDLKPGRLHQVNDIYFQRMTAIEFTLNHDNGNHLETIHLADIVILGPSRTSKTPLALTLAQQGYKVVNFPLKQSASLPKNILDIDQNKIFALTIDSESLSLIRHHRMNTSIHLENSEIDKNYAKLSQVNKDIEYCEELYKANPLWPVLNVTQRSVEDTAQEIIEIIHMRQKNLEKKSQRHKS